MLQIKFNGCYINLPTYSFETYLLLKAHNKTIFNIII